MRNYTTQVALVLRSDEYTAIISITLIAESFDKLPYPD
jgi:hypothetical protein